MAQRPEETPKAPPTEESSSAPPEAPEKKKTRGKNRFRHRRVSRWKSLLPFYVPFPLRV